MTNSTWNLRLEPRQWQTQAFERWLRNGRQGVVKVVTGAGKTVLAEMCMESVRSRSPDTRFCVVVPTVALVDQWYVSLTEELSVPSSQIKTFGGGSGRERSFGIVNLMVVDTARSWAGQLAKTHSTFLVVDECHRAGSPANSQVLAGPHAATLGLSATPERPYDDAFENVVVPALGEVVFEYGYAEARRDGVISPFELVNVEFSLSQDEQQRYDKMTQRVGRLMSRRATGDDVDVAIRRALQQRAAISASSQFRVPASVHLVERSSTERTLVFHERVTAADQIVALLQERGHRTAAYHTRLSPELRRDNLRLYREGKFDVLVTCRALDEGTNVPETSVAVIASSTASPRQRIQRLGRVLRPAEGKTRAKVFTLYATDAERRRLLEEASNDIGAEDVSWYRASV